MPTINHITAANSVQKKYGAAPAVLSQQQRQLVIIDPHVDQWQILAAGVTPNTEVHILDPNRDGITQITEILEERKEGRGERKENFFSLPPSSMAASPSSLSPLSSFLFLSTSSPTGLQEPST